MSCKRNNGIDKADILQNQFTAYLITSVHRTKNHYRHKIVQREIHEFPLEDQDVAAISELELELPTLAQVENLRLYRALVKMKQRDLDILLARAISDKTCAEIAEEMGITSKHIATIYGRAIEKIKKEMMIPDELS